MKDFVKHSLFTQSGFYTDMTLVNEMTIINSSPPAWRNHFRILLIWSKVISVKLYQPLGILNITRIEGEGKDSTMWVIVFYRNYWKQLSKIIIMFNEPRLLDLYHQKWTTCDTAISHTSLFYITPNQFNFDYFKKIKGLQWNWYTCMQCLMFSCNDDQQLATLHTTTIPAMLKITKIRGELQSKDRFHSKAGEFSQH